MINLDNIIGRMRASNCSECNCQIAISDISGQNISIGQKVEIYGSFCYPVPGHTHIEIIARDRTSKNTVWLKVCDTGQMCSIPFTSEEGFQCDD